MSATWMAFVAFVVCAVPAAAQDGAPFKDSRERTSYALGLEAGQQFRTRAIDLDVDAFAKGLKAALGGATPLMTDDQMRRAIAALQADLKRREFEARTAWVAASRKEAEAFLAENAKNEGVVSLPSGLQYRVLAPGSGRTPRDTDTVEYRYRGTLASGMQFDDSSRLASTVTVRVDQTIAGIREALRLMSPGARWRIFVPPGLVSGPPTAMAMTPPDQLLIFDVELVAIK